jgi:polar amino acid transport system permease protein
MTTSSEPSYRSKVPLPGWLDRLVVRIAQWPWWALLIAFALVIMFYSFATSPFYRRALDWEVDQFRPTTDEFADVAYKLKTADGKGESVSGILTSEDRAANTVTIITQAEQQVTLPYSDIGTFTCGDSKDPNACPLNQKVSLVRSQISGVFIQDDLGFYLVTTDDGDVRVLTYSVADKPKDQQQPKDPLNPKLNKDVKLNPPDCNANPDGGCQITLQLKPDSDVNNIQGVLVERNSDSILVQTQPRTTRTINRSDILQEVNNTPKVCALNNLVACTEGIWLTPYLTAMAFALALLIGLILGLMRVSTDPVLFNIATVYIEVIRGIPIVVILLFTSFALAPFLRDNLATSAPPLPVGILVTAVLAGIWFAMSRLLRPSLLTEIVRTFAVLAAIILLPLGLINAFNFSVNLDVVQRGILGLGVCYGAFLAELFRAGIQSIGKGQMEAARSLGMTYTQAMRFVILPQAFRVILPPLGNEFIAILKDTSLVTILAIAELTQRGRLFAAETFKPFPVYVTIGTLYLCMTLLLSLGVRVLERRLTVAHR